VRELLRRGLPYMVWEQFGQPYVIPNQSTVTARWRRYEALDNTPAALTEGVTPASKSLRKTDYVLNLTQYGDLVTLTDIVIDSIEDPVLNETVDILAEQAPQMIELVRYNTLVAGSNVLYGNGAVRSAVNTAISQANVRRLRRTLKRQLARKMTKRIPPTPDYNTVPLQPSYIGAVHPDMESDILDLPDFVPIERYSGMTPWENEVGKSDQVRYLTSTLIGSFPDAGGAQAGAGYNTITTSGTSSDVYPLIVFGMDAYGIVSLKGQSALVPMVVNPKPTDSDPLAQRGHAAWKAMQGAVILNDAWIIRGEFAVKA
jgi:N4-gp56 family major capsid protein